MTRTFPADKPVVKSHLIPGHNHFAEILDLLNETIDFCVVVSRSSIQKHNYALECGADNAFIESEETADGNIFRIFSRVLCPFCFNASSFKLQRAKKDEHDKEK